MHTAPTGRCQSAPGAAPGGASWRKWVFLFAGLMLLNRTVSADGPAPAPPDWQRDLNAAHVLQAALAIAPTAGHAADDTRRQQLGKLYGQLITKYPEQTEVQRAAAIYYDETGQHDPALFCWQHAAALDPQDAATADALGQEWLGRGRIPEACAQFDRAVAARPDVASYHFDLANVLYLFRKQLLAPPKRSDEQAVLREALEQFRLAAAFSPTDVGLAQAYAETFYIFAHPDWEQALAAWKAVLALSGQDSDLANGHLARISLRLRRPEDMETYLARIHSPAFDVMKIKFRQQAAVMRAPGSPVPGGSPAATPAQ